MFDSLPSQVAEMKRASDELATPLTDRERRVLQLVAHGLVTPEIAVELAVSPETVKSHVHNVMMKLGARTRAHAVALAAADGQIALVSEGPPAHDQAAVPR